MKKVLSLFLVMSVLLGLCVGCGGVSDEEITEVVQVLYVEKDGFLAELNEGTSYVLYPNADAAVKVGDRVELVYLERSLLIADAPEPLGGYSWDYVLTNVTSLQVK